MEHESFADEEVAVLLNKDFAAVKVDREERPDLDSRAKAIQGQHTKIATVYHASCLRAVSNGP